MKRSPINRVSSKRRLDNELRKRAMQETFGEPDTWTCQVVEAWGTPCFGAVHGHEILKRSRGGSITDMNNVILACDHHNSEIENHPEKAHRLGLARHSWEIPGDEVKRMYREYHEGVGDVE